MSHLLAANSTNQLSGDVLTHILSALVATMKRPASISAGAAWSTVSVFPSSSDVQALTSHFWEVSNGKISKDDFIAKLQKFMNC